MLAMKRGLLRGRWRLLGTSLLGTSLVALGSPGLAYACPVCFQAKDEANRLAFLGTTVFLTALPLILIGLFIGWITRRANALAAESIDMDAASEEPAPAAGDPVRGAVVPLRRQPRVDAIAPGPEHYSGPR